MYSKDIFPLEDLLSCQISSVRFIWSGIVVIWMSDIVLGINIYCVCFQESSPLALFIYDPFANVCHHCGNQVALSGYVFVKMMFHTSYS